MDLAQWYADLTAQLANGAKLGPGEFFLFNFYRGFVARCV